MMKFASNIMVTRSRIMQCIAIMCLCVACSELDAPIPPAITDSDQPIILDVEGWKPMTSTRGLIESLDGFVLYGYKSTNGEDASPVFMNQKVEYISKSWTYSPTKYWDRTADYYFGAYAPTNLSNDITVTHEIKKTDDNTNGNHCLTFTIPHWQVAASGTDLVTATSKGHATTYLSNEKGVNLTFSHTFGYIEIQLIKGTNIPNNCTYTLKNLTYHNVPSATASATYTLDYTAGTSALSTITAESNYTVYDADNGAGTVIGNDENPTNFSHLVVPFTSEAITLSLTYTTSQNGNTFEYTRDIDPQLNKIEAGRKYILTLTFIGGAEIEPEISIAEWNDVPVDNPVYNW